MRKIFRWQDCIAFALITLLTYIVIFYTVIHWIGSSDAWFHPFTFWFISLIFAGKLLISQSRWWLLPFMAAPIPRPPSSGLRVGVATTFVAGAESIEMLEESVSAMMAMDYPHDTWVLDEEDSPEVRRLCSRLGAMHFSRKDLAHYQAESGKYQRRSKHGNYNSWLNEIGFGRYDFITTFDPDHIPKRNFLTEVLGFFDDSEIGYVQAAQAYYNQDASFIARGAAEETYSYYSSTQMFCYAAGYPVVTGCHSTHRASALKQVGGLAAHDADDLLITLLYRVSGWKGVYVPKILARGLTPVDWEGYFTQQLRWARSVLDIKFRIYPKMVSRLPLKEIAVSFLHGFYYLQGITTLFILLLLCYMLATGSASSVVNYFTSLNFVLLLAVLFVCDLYRQRFYLDRRTEAGLQWRAGVLQFAKYPYLVLAFCHVVSNRRPAYTVTNKSTASRRSIAPFVPHLAVAGLICVSWLVGLLSGRDLSPVIQTAAAIAVVGTVALAATALFRFPDPYPSRREIPRGEGGQVHFHGSS
ncbi:MAG TPA: glycosyltransferase family 2 protein [Pyrinomonadaceae bacterium]